MSFKKFSFKKIIETNLRFRWLVIGFFLLLTVLSATQLPKLRFDFSPEAMLEFSQEEIAYQKAFDEKFSSNANIFLVVLSAQESLLTARSLTDLRDLTAKLSSSDGVTFAYSLALIPSTDVSVKAILKGAAKPILGDGVITEEMAQSMRDRVSTSSILKGNLISADEHYALIMVSMDEGHIEPEEFLSSFELIKADLEAWQASEGREMYKLEYGGLPYIRALTVDTMKSEQLFLWPIVGLLYVIALTFLFRSFLQAALPLLCIGCVILWAIAAMVLLGIPVTMINNTLPLLILVIGVTNSIYVVMRIIDERARGKDDKVALRDGVYRVALATLLTTSTTAIGFGSLFVARSTILNSFGLLTALAIMLIYVSIIFFMPQVASFLNLDRKRKASADTAKIDGYIERVVGVVVNFSIRRKWWVLGGSIVLLGICFALGSEVSFNGKINDVFEPSHPVAVTNTIIEEHLGGILPLEVDITASQEAYFRDFENIRSICMLQDKIATQSGVITTLSICNILREAGVSFEEPPTQRAFEVLLAGIKRVQPDQLKAFMTDKGDNVHISIRIPDNGVLYAQQTIEDIKKLCDESFKGSGVEYRLTGIAYNSTLGLNYFIRDLFNSLMTAFVIIFFVLLIAFRSFWSGVISLLPNLLPLLITLALMLVYGYDLNTTSVLVFTISIGLAVDNSIHIIQRFRQEYRFSVGVAEAIRKAMQSTGRAIVQSNLLLCSGLGILLFSSFEPIARVGILTMTTIGSALVVSVILLPAELAIIGHRMKLKRFVNAEKRLAVVKEARALSSSKLEKVER